jgi:hypothetical protein
MPDTVPTNTKRLKQLRIWAKKVMRCLLKASPTILSGIDVPGSGIVPVGEIKSCHSQCRLVVFKLSLALCKSQNVSGRPLGR